MIKMNLEILEPNPRDAVQLRALAAMFLVLADGSKADQVRAELADKAGAGMAGFSPARVAPYAGVLDPADNPAAGIPSPSEAFGVGNGVAGSGSASSPSNATTGAALTIAHSSTMTSHAESAPGAALPDPATAFGGVGNAPAVPAPSNGPPALPAVTPPITPPGSLGAPAALPSPGIPAPASAAAPGLAGSISHAQAVEVDAEGLPWDASIHASTKARIANGTWKVKRGTGEAYLLERKALLKAAVNAGGNAGTPATPPAGAGAPGNVPAAMIPTPQASQQTTPAAAASNVVTMARVLPRVTAAITGGLLTADSAAAIVHELSGGQINNVAMLAVAPQLLAPFAARLDLLGIPQ